MASHWFLGGNITNVNDLPHGWISSGTRACQSLYRHPLGPLFHLLAHMASIHFTLWAKTGHLDSHRTWHIGLKTISPYQFGTAGKASLNGSVCDRESAASVTGVALDGIHKIIGFLVFSVTHNT